MIKEDWILNDIVLPKHLNDIGKAINKADRDITQLNTEVTSNTDEINILKNDVTTNIGKINNLTADLGSAKSDIIQLKTDVGTNRTNVSNLTTKVNTNTSDIETLKTNVSSNIGKINTLTTDLGKAKSDITQLKTDVGTNKTNINNLTNDLDKAKKAINNKVGWGDNNYANPEITLFGQCGLDATANNGVGQGNVLRVKFNDNNYYLIGINDARIFLNGLAAVIFKKDYGSDSKALTIRDTHNSGSYHNFIGNESSGLKFLSSSATLQVRDGADNNYGNLKLNDLSYITLTNSSDRNLKENIKYIKVNEATSLEENYNETTTENYDITETDMYNLINSIDLYNFDYKEVENSNTIGFMAQDILDDKVGKKLVKEDIDGNLCFNLYSYISCLTGAFKEEIRKREALEVKLEEIINRIAN